MRLLCSPLIYETPARVDNWHALYMYIHTYNLIYKNQPREEKLVIWAKAQKKKNKKKRKEKSEQVMMIFFCQTKFTNPPLYVV